MRDGTRKMLQAAIENEVSEFIENYKNITNETGHRLIVRNGYLSRKRKTTFLREFFRKRNDIIGNLTQVCERLSYNLTHRKLLFSLIWFFKQKPIIHN